MKLSENLIRQLIQKSLLLEAKYQFRNLLIFKETIVGENNLFDEINSTFVQNGGPQHDLNNPKSAGRFFIDVLFECMEEINEIIDAGQQNQIDIPDRIMTICNYILFLFSQKEVTVRTVRSGQTFKDYILNFMTYYSKTSYPGTTTVYEKLSYVFGALNEKSAVSSLDSILRDKNYIKSEKETLYPFGKDTIVDGYKVVAPLSIRSSIFWARTNWLGEEIVLPSQEDISWCTARLRGGNMFNSYFVGGGTTLFYFLPEGDIEGVKKFCIGITKIKILDERSKLGKIAAKKKNELDSDDYEVWEYEQWKQNPADWKFKLNVGGNTTVGFENHPILEDETNDFSKKETRNKIKKALKLSNDVILLQFEKEMQNRDPIDQEQYTSLLDVEQFAASTNINSLAPIDPATGKRDRGDIQMVATSIENVLKTYNSKIYKAKGFVPDSKIVNYIDKNYAYWQKEGLNLSFYIPLSLRNNKEKILELLRSIIISSGKRIEYKKIKNMVSTSLTNDYDIFKYVFLSNIFYFMGDKDLIKDMELLTNPATRGFSKFIQFFEDSFETLRTDFSDFFDEKRQIIFSERISKIILSPNFKINEKIPNEKLANLFFTYRCPAFIKLLSYDYCLQNPGLLLKIAEFSKNKIFSKEGSVIDAVPSFLTSKYVKWMAAKDLEFGKHYLVPSELLSNKGFVEKLIAIDPSCLELLAAFGSNLSEDPDILFSFISGVKDIETIQENLNRIFNKKCLNHELITYDFLEKMCQSNIMIFYAIFDWAKYMKVKEYTSEEEKTTVKPSWASDDSLKIEKFKNSREQVENVLNFIIDFVSNRENVLKLVFSYNEGISDETLNPAEGLGHLFALLKDAIASNKSEVLSELYNDLTRDISLLKKVINIQKIKFKNKLVDEWYFVNSTWLISRYADQSIKDEIDEYIQNRDLITENKKLILTESQLRRLINYLL